MELKQQRRWRQAAQWGMVLDHICLHSCWLLNISYRCIAELPRIARRLSTQPATFPWKTRDLKYHSHKSYFRKKPREYFRTKANCRIFLWRKAWQDQPEETL